MYGRLTQLSAPLLLRPLYAVSVTTVGRQRAQKEAQRDAAAASAP
jgi:hypothetical protein